MNLTKYPGSASKSSAYLLEISCHLTMNDERESLNVNIISSSPQYRNKGILCEYCAVLGFNTQEDPIDQYLTHIVY